jgi:hypothetical protein
MLIVVSKDLDLFSKRVVSISKLALEMELYLNKKSRSKNYDQLF